MSTPQRFVQLDVFADRPGIGGALIAIDSGLAVPFGGRPVQEHAAGMLAKEDGLPARRYLARPGREVGREAFVPVEADDDGHGWIGGRSPTVVEKGLAW